MGDYEFIKYDATLNADKSTCLWFRVNLKLIVKGRVDVLKADHNLVPMLLKWLHFE